MCVYAYIIMCICTAYIYAHIYIYIYIYYKILQDAKAGLALPRSNTAAWLKAVVGSFAPHFQNLQRRWLFVELSLKSFSILFMLVSRRCGNPFAMHLRPRHWGLRKLKLGKWMKGINQRGWLSTRETINRHSASTLGANSPWWSDVFHNCLKHPVIIDQQVLRDSEMRRVATGASAGASLDFAGHLKEMVLTCFSQLQVQNYTPLLVCRARPGIASNAFRAPLKGCVCVLLQALRCLHFSAECSILGRVLFGPCHHDCICQLPRRFQFTRPFGEWWTGVCWFLFWSGMGL